MTASPNRDALLADLADRVPRSLNDDCVRVAVDGVDGARKTVFADGLAAVARADERPVIRI